MIAIIGTSDWPWLAKACKISLSLLHAKSGSGASTLLLGSVMMMGMTFALHQRGKLQMFCLQQGNE